MPPSGLDYDDVAALRAASVAWYAANPLRPDEAARGLGPPVWGPWRPVPDPLPRARLVSHTRTSRSPGDDLKVIDLNKTALVSRHVELSPGPPGAASIVTDRPGSVRLNVEAPGRQLLVLSDTYHSGWRAQVDGKPVEIRRVNGDFMGCVIEKGSHLVEFDFRPVALAWGKLLSLLGLAVGICVCGTAAAGFVRRAAAA